MGAKCIRGTEELDDDTEGKPPLVTRLADSPMRQMQGSSPMSPPQIAGASAKPDERSELGVCHCRCNRTTDAQEFTELPLRLQVPMPSDERLIDPMDYVEKISIVKGRPKWPILRDASGSSASSQRRLRQYLPEEPQEDGLTPACSSRSRDSPQKMSLEEVLHSPVSTRLQYSLTSRSHGHPEPVILNIYDLGSGNGCTTVNKVLRTLGTGAFHCGVEVYGCEWSYSDTEDGMGDGVFASHPRCCDSHTYSESVPMGMTSMREEDVLQLINLLKGYWPVAAYETLSKNCCHFCDELCQRLRVGPIPKWVMSLAGAGAAIAATGDTLCCREVIKEMAGRQALQTFCCYDSGGDLIQYHL